jgi:hypothetical protein
VEDETVRGLRDELKREDDKLWKEVEKVRDRQHTLAGVGTAVNLLTGQILEVQSDVREVRKSVEDLPVIKERLSNFMEGIKTRNAETTQQLKDQSNKNLKVIGCILTAVTIAINLVLKFVH